MRQYFQRKLGIYILTFFVAVTVDWMIPRFMPGDPVQTMLSRASLRPEAAQSMQSYLNGVFGLDVPLWRQYLNFWGGLLHGDLGVSVWLFPQPVTGVILRAIPYTLALLVPAILLSWWAPWRPAASGSTTPCCRSATSSPPPPTCGWPSCWPGCSAR